MRLTLDDIKKVTVGAVNVFEDTDGFHFRKFSDRQIAFWYSVRRDLGDRSKDSTGIRLDMHTNSKSIRFSAPRGDSFDLYIDGILRKRFDTKATRKYGTEVCFDIRGVFGEPLDTARVTLYLPSHSEGVLEYVELDDAATITPHCFKQKILFIGDSITQGAIAEHDSLSYSNRVARFFDAESITQSVSGSYFCKDSFEKTGLSPDTVIIAYGTNDFAHFKTYEEMESAASEYFDAVLSAYGNTAKRIFYISAPWQIDYAKIRTMGGFAESRERLIAIAVSKGLIHINGLKLIPASTEFLADGSLHPNDVGFGIYAENLIKEMLKHI